MSKNNDERRKIKPRIIFFHNCPRREGEKLWTRLHTVTHTDMTTPLFATFLTNRRREKKTTEIVFHFV